MITKEAREKMGWRKGLTFTAIEKVCEVCDKKFKTVPTSQKQYCCSRKCRFERMKKERIKYVCLICNKDIYDLKRKSGGRKYCSTKCKIEGLAKLKRERFKEKRIFGKWKGHKELKQYLLKKYNKCQLCEWDKEPNILEAHHKDRNKKNNNENNLLLICPNCHSLDHYKTKDGQYKNNLGNINNAINEERS